MLVLSPFPSGLTLGRTTNVLLDAIQLNLIGDTWCTNLNVLVQVVMLAAVRAGILEGSDHLIPE